MTTRPATIGAMFAGYGGLELAITQVLDAELAWYAEFDKAPAAIMAHHHPGIPNLGDVTKVDWSTVRAVDIITGGSPCQDLSTAGKRKGMTDGTRSNLWAEMREAIATIRPCLVIWENVRGALSAHADSDMEPCPGCVGSANDGPSVLRALGRVLGDLAELGYDARWYGLRAADVGAAHGRFRVFVFARPADPNIAGLEERVRPVAARPELPAIERPGPDDELTLLPTPRATDGTKGGPNQRGSTGDLMLPSAVHATRWGDYAEAIARAEATFAHRPAPDPTELNAKGGHRLSPLFVEWLMGLPAGHVTDVPDITRNAQLRALGNGVCPPQAAAALRAYLEDERQSA